MAYDRNAFRLALARRDLELFKRTFTAQNVNSTKNPFIETVDKGYIEMVQYLIALGVNVEMQDARGRTALNVAAKNGNFELCELLLPLFPFAIHIRDDEGKLPIHSAATLPEEYEGYTVVPQTNPERVKICRFLIEAGSDLDEIDNNDVTPLGQAIEDGMCDVALYLINAGASVYRVAFRPNQSIMETWALDVAEEKELFSKLAATFLIMASPKHRSDCWIYPIIHKDMMRVIAQCVDESEVSEYMSEFFLCSAESEYRHYKALAESTSKKQRTGE